MKGVGQKKRRIDTGQDLFTRTVVGTPEEGKQYDDGKGKKKGGGERCVGGKSEKGMAQLFNPKSWGGDYNNDQQGNGKKGKKRGGGKPRGETWRPQ